MRNHLICWEENGNKKMVLCHQMEDTSTAITRDTERWQITSALE